MDNFINIKFTYRNLPIYFVRKSIFSALKIKLNNFKGKLLDIGCGKLPYKNYILKNSKVVDYLGIDIENALNYENGIKPDMTWNGLTLPFSDSSFDTILSTEVLEHCPQPMTILKESHRVLKNDGIIFLTTPFIFPLHESPHDENRLTPYSIERMAKEIGFKKIEIQPLGGINAVISQILGIYPINKFLKALFIWPLIYILIKTDKKPNQFKDGVIFTGIYAILTK